MAPSDLQVSPGKSLVSLLFLYYFDSWPSDDQHSIPEPHIILKTKKVNKRVCLNVGGERHEVMWRVLQNIPNSRLGRLEKAGSHEEILRLCSDYSLLDNE